MYTFSPFDILRTFPLYFGVLGHQNSNSLVNKNNDTITFGILGICYFVILGVWYFGNLVFWEQNVCDLGTSSAR